MRVGGAPERKLLLRFRDLKNKGDEKGIFSNK
jgi:hypothetical protein